MKALTCLLLLVCLASACSAHHGPAADASSSHSTSGSARYVIGVLPLRPVKPEAAAEAQAQDALFARAMTSILQGTPLEVVHPNVLPPASPEQAPALIQATKVDALLWGDVSLENGKLTVKLSSFERTVNAPNGMWPMAYTLADPKQRELRELDALRVTQFLLELSLLPQMMRDRPVEVRRTLEAMVSRRPMDWVDLNHDLVERRWGMLGRLTRDGAFTEKRYRAALADVAAARAKSSTPPSEPTLIKEAFYSVGLARGFLLQGRPQAAVELLSDVVRRRPQDSEARLLLGRSWLAVGEKAKAAEVLEPLSEQGADPVATRLYVVAVAGQPERVKTALARLQEKQPADATARLVGFVAAPGSEAAASLKQFAEAQTSGEWPLPVAHYLLGALDEQALWAATKDTDDHLERIRRCQAHYFLGEVALAGALPGRSGASDQAEARKHFEAAIATHAFHQPTYELADARLEQLQHWRAASRMGR